MKDAALIRSEKNRLKIRRKSVETSRKDINTCSLPVVLQKPSSRVIYWTTKMLREAFPKRTIAYIDGQNLFHAVRETFGYTYPNYDILKLAESVCQLKNWQLIQTKFYTGIPDPKDDPAWNHFWVAKLGKMGHQKNVDVFSRLLRYRNKIITSTRWNWTHISRCWRKRSRCSNCFGFHTSSLPQTSWCYSHFQPGPRLIRGSWWNSINCQRTKSLD